MSTYDPYGTTYGAEAAAGAAVGVFFLIFGIIMLVALAVSVLAIVGQWKAFKKAGKNGWEALIPVYNQMTLCEVVGLWKWWPIVILVSPMLSIIPVIGSLASSALSIYFLVILNVSTARSFGKSDGFAAGLVFLAPIFWLIVGGKNTQYVGATPMKDPVMDFVNEKFLNKDGNNTANQNMNNGMNQNMGNGGFTQNQPVNNMPNNYNPTSNPVKFCTTCGYKIENGEHFCPGCGNQVQ